MLPHHKKKSTSGKNARQFQRFRSKKSCAAATSILRYVWGVVLLVQTLSTLVYIQGIIALLSMAGVLLKGLFATELAGRAPMLCWPDFAHPSRAGCSPALSLPCLLPYALRRFGGMCCFAMMNTAPPMPSCGNCGFPRWVISRRRCSGLACMGSVAVFAKFVSVVIFDPVSVMLMAALAHHAGNAAKKSTAPVPL